ncbi:uncharacterized protein [Primulina eburnea]|uniref:uncharacterized protein n=1 Tax=Primulina eburnea TaxID=1245227 RepID=UPI003C6C4E39
MKKLAAFFSTKFCSESVVSQWSLYAHRVFIKERNIYSEAYGRHNLIDFLHARGLIATLDFVMPYARSPVLEFYCNLVSSSIGDGSFAKYGRMFVRDVIYDFSPYAINEFYNTPMEGEEDDIPDIDAITSVLTDGLITQFSTHPKQLAAATLKFFNSVLHKTAIRNWTPSNTIVVTRPQAVTLFTIGTGRLYNFGQLVFNTILQFAEGRLKSTNIPFPSLIFWKLESQGLLKEDDETLSDASETLKIAPAYFNGNRKLDILWSASGVATGVGNTRRPHLSPLLKAISCSLPHIYKHTFTLVCSRSKGQRCRILRRPSG